MKEPPPVQFDAESEEQFIGCILASEGEVIDRLEESLQAALFWTPTASLVFQACMALRAASEPVGVLTVTGWLREKWKLADAGGAAKISEMSGVGSTSLAEHWLKKLQDQLSLRRLQHAADWTLTAIRGGATPAAVIEGAKFRIEAAEPSADVCDSHALPVVVTDLLAKLDRMDAGEVEPGLRTGVSGWDTLFAGLLPGQYYGLGGRPGHGKSAMMEQIIFKLVASDDVPVLVFEKDMSLGMLIERISCRAAGVPYWKFVRRMTNRIERDQVRMMVRGLGESKLRLHNPTNLTAEKLCAIARREQRQHGVQATFLDHIQLLDVGNELRQGLTSASICLRRHITESGIPFMALFQINRTGAKGRPTGEDVKEFDQLLADVDALAMLWSPVKREELEPGHHWPINLLAPKNRTGAVAEEEMLFDGQLMQFLPADDKLKNRHSK